MNEYDIKYMKIALEEARASENDVPVGAVLVYNDEIICEAGVKSEGRALPACMANSIIVKAHNRKELENDATCHAEIIVIKEASQKIKNWRLNNTVLYVTLEPCPMCAAAILYSRIPKIVFGAYDPLYGAFGSTIDMRDLIKFNPEIIGGILEEDCSKILKAFFGNQRNIKE